MAISRLKPRVADYATDALQYDHQNLCTDWKARMLSTSDIDSGTEDPPCYDSHEI